MLVRGLFIPGGETVVDMTGFSERTDDRVAGAAMDPPSRRRVHTHKSAFFSY